MTTGDAGGRAARHAVTDAVIDAATQRLAAKASRSADKMLSKAARHAESLERLASHLEALDLWTRNEPGARKPRFTREQLAAAAVRIADTEGFAALSMRRLAAELSAGTMTLYHYVRTKDELLTLVSDAIMAEVVVPDDQPLPAAWRDALVVIAHRSRDAMRRHPWILDITDDPPLGPNSVRHFDQSMQAVSSFPGTLHDRLDLVTTVDEYVFGYCLHERNNVTDGELMFDEPTVQYVMELIGTGDFPALEQILHDEGPEGAWTSIYRHARDEQRFDRNLHRLLDGFERAIR